MITYPPTAAQLNSIYLRLAVAYRRQQARRAIGAHPLHVGEGRGAGPEPLTITTGGHGGRGPYRPRTQRLNHLTQDTRS